MNLLAAFTSAGDVNGFLNSTTDLFIIASVMIGGLAAAVKLIVRIVGKRFDKQDDVLQSILGTLSDHHVRIVRVETRIEQHEKILYPRQESND
jgi:hypothetical protein